MHTYEQIKIAAQGPKEYSLHLLVGYYSDCRMKNDVLHIARNVTRFVKWVKVHDLDASVKSGCGSSGSDCARKELHAPENLYVNYE